MAEIIGAAVDGTLAPKIALMVPLTDAIPAIIALETTGLPKGKVIIAPAP